MGIPISVLGKLGLPGVNSLSTDQMYTKYFGDKNIKKYEDFHVAFLLLCNDFNAIMPGKHYKIKATREEIEEFYQKKWRTAQQDTKESSETGEQQKTKEEQQKTQKPKEETKEEQKKTKEEQQNKTRKDLVVEFMKEHVEEYKTSSSAMIWVGATAPGAAVLLKKSGEKVPQVKKLRIDLVPNFVFVPTVTMLSLIAVRMLNVTKTSRSTS